MKTLHLAIAAVLSSSQLAAQPGAIDLTFNPGSGVDSLVRSVIVQTGGKIIIGGDFVSVNGTPRKNIARLNSDGSLDNAFDPGAGFNDGVYAIALQPDGKILVGGGFSVFNGTPIKSLARLNANGTLDNSFGSSVDAGGSVYGIALQPDGKAIIGGSFSEYGGEVVGFIARVNSNGSLDNAFAANTGDGFNAGTWRIALQDDGKAVVVGAFNEFDGTPRERIIRLNNDGSLDASFDPGAGFSNWTLGLALQPDGKVLVGGLFTEFDNNSREFVARLNSDGSIDPSFDATTAVNWHVFNLLLQPDGKVIVIEWGYPLQLVRLNADGTKDPTFVTGSGFVGGGLDGGPASFALQADGRLLVGGRFASYNGTARSGIVRILTGLPSTVEPFHASSNLNIWPNPTFGALQISSPEEIRSLVVTDILGNAIVMESPRAKSATIDLSDQASGLYLIRALTDSSERVTKVVKQ